MTVVQDEEVDARPLWQRARCWDGPTLQSTVFPPLEWAVPGLIPAGLSLLVGAPKVGKSWAGLDVALAVASGGLALGALPVEEGDALYLALEDGPRRLQDRTDLLYGRDRPWPARFHAYTEWDRGRAAAAGAWDWCRDHPQARLVVVDTLARIRAPRAGNGRAYDEDTAELVPWQKIAEAHSVAVVVVHHDRKADSGDFIDAVSGTHGLAGVADTTLVLDRTRMEDYGRLRLTGRDVTERELTLHRTGPAWQIHEGPAPDPDLSADSSRILAAVHELGEARAADVVKATGLDAGTVRRYLARHAENHRLTKTGRGLYTPVPTVPTVPTETQP